MSKMDKFSEQTMVGEQITSTQLISACNDAWEHQVWSYLNFYSLHNNVSIIQFFDITLKK